MDMSTYLRLAALATTAVPGLEVCALSHPQKRTEDYEMTGLVDALSHRWIVLGARTASGGRRLETQMLILGHLANYRDAGRLSFDIPRPKRSADTSTGGHVLVYRVLAGRDLVMNDLDLEEGLDESLGCALASLHELPPNLVEHVGLPSYSADQTRQRVQNRIDEVATSGLIPSGLLERWEGVLQDVAWWRFASVTSHGDASATSFRVEGNQIVGMQGFTNVQVGDPATDFSWLVAEASDQVLENVFAAYHLHRKEGCDPHLRERAEFYGELALVDWLEYGIEIQDQAIIDEAGEMLHELAEVTGVDTRISDETNTTEIDIYPHSET